MVEAIFFDIDGTLLSFETHKMTATLQEALLQLKNKGIKLFIATGRHVSEMDELKKYPYFDGYITLNGAYCYNEDGAYFKVPLTKEDTYYAIEEAKKMTHPIALITEKEMTLNFINDYVIRATSFANVPIPRIEDPETLRNKELYQLILYVHPNEDKVVLRNMKSLSYARWHPDFVDVVPADITKKQGIEETCKYYHIDIKNCMAFGDSANDLEMLKAVGYGIAMGNGSEEIKAAAKEVTLSVNEDGIIHSLKKHNLL